MKGDVIEQRGRGGGGGNTVGVARPVDYMSSNSNMNNNTWLASHFIMECGEKLSLRGTTSATAAAMLHTFYKVMDINTYDPYMIAAGCLSIAGKIRDESIRPSNVINVCHHTLHKGPLRLNLSSDYEKFRPSLFSAELFILRTLAFKLDFPLPHRYLLHYLKSLQEWLPESEWQSAPIARMSMAFLQDFYLSPSVLDYQPSHIAIACLALTLNTLGVAVPLTFTQDDENPWYLVLTKDLTKDKTWEIMEKIMAVYNRDGD